MGSRFCGVGCSRGVGADGGTELASAAVRARSMGARGGRSMGFGATRGEGGKGSEVVAARGRLGLD